jgi:prolyl-tRNA synthetase
VVGERGLKEGKLEYQGRCDPASTPVALGELIAFVKARLCAP